MQTLYISVASHNNEKFIKQNFSNYPKEVDGVKLVVAIIDNIGAKELEEFCKEKGYHYYCDRVKRGYGENHNKNFEVLAPKDDDSFLVINPDIFLDIENINGLIDIVKITKADLVNIKSYLNSKDGILDYPDRYYPGILNFFISLATGKRLHYGKNEKVKNPEWMSGGFILFKALSYKKLSGFDEDYFMYCEDIDICYRAKKMGLVLEYNDKYYNIHHSQMDSRSIFSKSMFYHLKSAFLFVLKNRFYKPVAVARS